MNMRMFLVFPFVMFPATASAQRKTQLLSVKQSIYTGNQARIDGMKAGDVRQFGASYSEDAVDCDPTGKCVEGHRRIEQQIARRFSSFGRTRSAAVSSWGITEHGSFAYECGQAEAGPITSG